MNRITHRYYVSLHLLEDIERFVNEKNPTIDELKCYFRRAKLRYRTGLVKLDD